jgi:hypothetical protein
MNAIERFDQVQPPSNRSMNRFASSSVSSSRQHGDHGDRFEHGSA